MTIHRVRQDPKGPENPLRQNPLRLGSPPSSAGHLWPALRWAARVGEHNAIARAGAAAVEINASGSRRFLTLIPMTQGGQGRQRLFPNEFEDTFAVGPEPGNDAFFGLNVLQGLVDGIDDFVNERQARWRPRVRLLGPALLGSSVWIEDGGLIDKISDLYAACIVVKKQSRKPKGEARLAELTALNTQTPGMPIQAFSALSGLAPKVDGKAVTVGPQDAYHEASIPTIRTLGFRQSGDNDDPPIPHAKLALLGHLWWHDEDAQGHVEDIVGFDARRLWISSANFTSSSRRNIEFGYWTEDPALIQGAERLLVTLMGSSEALDPDSDLFDPELLEVASLKTRP